MTNVSLAAAALLVGMASAASAQKEHIKVQVPHAAHIEHRAHVEHAAKVEHADHESARAAEMEHTAKVEDHAQDRNLKDALHSAHDQSSRLTHGIKLTATERRTVNAIHKKYEMQLKALKKDEHTADKIGASDAAYQKQVADLMAKERAELRAALPASAQAKFDANAAVAPRKQ